MQGIPAVVMQEQDLRQIIISASREAARQVLAEYHGQQSNTQTSNISQLLQAYLQDRTTIAKPRELWASSRDIRALLPNQKGKPKSYSWFQRFKRDSGLDRCTSRKSSHHGRLLEWCFEDIANAWLNWRAGR